MALKLRLTRGGSKKRPFYRIVVAEATAPRDGRFVEKVGTYNPLLKTENSQRVVLNRERISYWLSVGVIPTDRVARFLGHAGLAPQFQIHPSPVKSAPGKKARALAAAG